MPFVVSEFPDTGCVLQIITIPTSRSAGTVLYGTQLLNAENKVQVEPRLGSVFTVALK